MKIAVFIVLLVMTSQAMADGVLKTQTLLSLCKGYEQPGSENFDHGICLGTIIAAIQIADVQCYAQKNGGGKMLSAGLPLELTNAQGIEIFMKWAEANPSQWDKPAAYGVMSALAIAYPCR